MIYTLANLVKDVMSAMGETTEVSPSPGISGIPSPSDIMHKKISSLLPAVGGKLLIEASPEMLAGAEDYKPVFNSCKSVCGLYAFDITLPEDFIRLVSLKMKSWKRSINTFVTPGSQSYMRRSSPEPAIAGSPDRPMAYLCGDVLSVCGSESASDSPEHLLIWRIPRPDSAGNFRFPASLYPALLTRLTDLIH